MANLLRI